jgi:scyllo-inositol 2-dehydrogenase (NADP+)
MGRDGSPHSNVPQSGSSPRNRSPLTLAVAAVGAGWVTCTRHLPALTNEPRVRVLGIVDKHADRARAAATRFGLPHWSTTLDDPWLQGVECLTIGTPPPEHARFIEIAVGRGWHCLCEKPFALPASTGRELAQAAASASLVLGVVHNFQFSRSGRRLFALVESGRLGSIESVHAFQLSNPRRRLPSWYQSLPGGLFLDEAPHLLYLLRRVLGSLEVRTVDARVDGSEVRNLTATFEHESTWATLSMGFTAAVSEWQFIVVGDRGVAALDVFRDILVTLPNDGAHRAREILRSSSRMVGGHAAGVAASGARMVARRLQYGNDEVVRRFVDAVEGRPERLRWMSAEDGVAVVACMQHLLERVGVDLTPPPSSSP